MFLEASFLSDTIVTPGLSLWFQLWLLFVAVGSATVISPLELIRTKLQSQKQSYGELTSLIRSAVQAEGWWSLWRGLGPTLLRDVPFSAMYWYNYERGKNWLCQWYNTREPTFTITFISGAGSGSVSTSPPPSGSTIWMQNWMTYCFN